MLITQFYQLIDSELTTILATYTADERTNIHKDVKQNKGYALLIWFLQFYGQKAIYKNYITDGTDDSSCDIIFSHKNAQNEDIFYVIQSKFVHFDGSKKKEDEFPRIDKKTFGYTLNDFSVLLGGSKSNGKNENFNRKYAELKQHLDANGKVKFIYFTLAKENPEIMDSIVAFNKNYAPNISLEIIDFERIKRDYIEFIFKEITTNNPLEYSYNSEDALVELPIERYKDSKRDIFEFEGRARAYTLLLKPKTIHQLFKKYRFSLFFKNVRNPIHRSNYNQKIVDTLLKKPDSFWYFNNGITAITHILPDIGIHAKKIELEGLQIINGAQTVYSVYSAYENATPIQRKAMDAYTQISLRLIGSSDEEFNLQITRYTNMQNPMHNRDFFANDDIQQQLQNASFATNIWYEKRHDEFRLSEEKQKKLGIDIVSNTEMVAAYVSFHLQRPSDAIFRQEDFFVSRQDDAKGLYEEIFNRNTKYEDIYASFWVMKTLIFPHDDSYDWRLKIFFVALSKIVMQKYYAITRPNEHGKIFNLNAFIVKSLLTKNGNDLSEMINIFLYTIAVVLKAIENTDENIANERAIKLLTKPSFYDALVEKVEEESIDIAAIQNINLDEQQT